MKAISLLQPWASLVVLGYKKIETRTRNTSHRGPLLIHASLGKEHRALAGKEPFNRFLPAIDRVKPRSLTTAAFHKVDFDALPFGAIIGMVDVVATASTNLLDKAGRNPMSFSSLSGHVDCQDGLTYQERAFGDYSPGRYGYLLANVMAFPEPIPARGRLGLWQPDAETMVLVNEAIAATKK